MTGIAIYSTDFDPQRLYTDGDVSDLDEDRIAEMVSFGDAPLDLLVDTGERRISWALRGDRVTTATRTGYYIADFHTDGDLFGEFARTLMSMHEESEWSFRYIDNLRWEAGFQLWRVEADFPGIGDSERAALLDELRRRSAAADRTRPPLEFGMTSYHTALVALKALYESGVDCTVAIGTDGDVNALETVDVLLRPGAAREFEPRSEAARTVRLRTDGFAGSQDSTETTAETGDGDAGTPTIGLLGRLAGAIVFVLGALSLYSFVSSEPIHPITGLATLGGLIGSALAYPVLTRAVSPDRLAPEGSPTWAVVAPSSQQWWLLLGYGSLAGFAFPTGFRVAGTALGDSQWLFGTVTTLTSSLLSLVIYVPLLFIFAVVALRVLEGVDLEAAKFDPQNYPRLFLGHLLIGIGILLATGLSAGIWSMVIPAT